MVSILRKLLISLNFLLKPPVPQYSLPNWKQQYLPHGLSQPIKPNTKQHDNQQQDHS